MSILNIVYFKDDILYKKSKFIDVIDDNIRKTLDDMLETMYHNNGIGLAANQVGILQRFCVIDIPIDDQQGINPIKMINPEIIFKSKELSEYEEGCLSLPSVTSLVKRPREITVKYQDENNKFKELTTDGLLSTCIQHEVDHLDGILFIDYLSKIKRDILKKKLDKYLKNM